MRWCSTPGRNSRDCECPPIACAGRAGGVGLVALNLDASRQQTLVLPVAALRYTLGADALEAREVELNGRILALSGDRLPALSPRRQNAGQIGLAPRTITFLALPTAANPDCRRSQAAGASP